MRAEYNANRHHFYAAGVTIDTMTNQISHSSTTRNAEEATHRRRWLQNAVAFLIRALTRTKFIGIENFPPQDGVIVATNHTSRLDIPVLFVNPVRSDITALVADKYLKYPFFRWFTLAAGGIWLDRSKADFSAFGQALAVLQAGRALGIAPEGTRSETATLLEGKQGTVLLAHRARVPIVPVGISGTHTAQRAMLRLRRGEITVRFGKPFRLPPFSRDNREEDLQRQADEVMCRIAALLPPEYHGFYAGHPRLKELLAQGDF
ncbi:MAG: lysophospholipid acyltransferase family protein [Chloroflexota bacterium]|jgi:1-acyl-sn-glycerol-3-phosphate acyltransferase